MLFWVILPNRPQYEGNPITATVNHTCEPEKNQLPDFLVLGPHKVSSLALTQFLLLHPNITGPVDSGETNENELNYFSSGNYHNGFSW